MSARTNEHRYFLAAAALLAVLVISAFGFEYRDLIHPSQFTVLVQVHGLVMFAWIGLFLAQVALIVGHRPLWHRRLGVIGAGVAVLVVALGVPTSIAACRLEPARSASWRPRSRNSPRSRCSREADWHCAGIRVFTSG
jgi:uncharacterized membrane protein